MDWSSFDSAPQRWKPYVMKINKYLTGHADNFSIEIYKQDGIVDKISTFLNTVTTRSGDLSLSSKKSYLAALSTYLQIANIDSKPYKVLISKLAQQIRSVPITTGTDCSVTATDLEYAIKSAKVNYHIKLMSAILLYGYRKKLRLVDVCATRHDVNNGKDHYLDTTTGVWTLYNKFNALPVKIHINQDLLALINVGKGSVWVTGNKIVSTNSISMLFKQMFKHPYIAVAKILDPSASDESTEDVETIDPVPISVTDEPAPVVHVIAPIETVRVPVVAPADPVVPDKVKITIKPKPVANVRATQYEWSYFRRDKADDIHIQRVQQLMDMITSDHEYFYHSLVDNPQGVSNIEEKLKGIKSINSQVNYCNSLCKFLELTMARHYSDFTLLRDKLNLALHQHNASRSVTPYNEIVPRLHRVMTSKTSPDLKIMAMLLTSIQDYASMNTGALRFSDVMNTRLTDDGEHHYLDLTNKVWLLREFYTKNKQTRTALISDSFRDYMLSLNISTDVQLICHSGKTTNISKEFQKYIGINFSSVRASYVTYLDSVCDDVETIKQICNNQGHKLTTALESYRRIAETEED